VQQQYRLSNGGAVRITTAKYFTPLGRNIQRPYEQGKMAYEHDLMNRIQDNAKGKQDTAAKGKAFKTPKGRLVYGGGGIYPDKWVNPNALILDSAYRMIVEQSLLNDFVLHWYIAEQQNIKKYKNTKDFLTGYQKVDLWSALVKFANPQQKNNLRAVEKNKTQIQNQLLALIARMQWYKQGYFEVQNALNPQIGEMIP
jgi:carboxyl-terminal processing protease